jgi:cell wall-associated NlpC family hydrolase
VSDPLNGKAVIAVFLGVTFVWSGIKGWSVLGTLGDLIKGQKPAQSNDLPLGGVGTAGLAPAGVGSFAQAGLQYVGHAYSFGGAPKRDGSGAWDCSSFVNYVVGVRGGLSIPGYKAGGYDGSSHGPTTVQWASWPGLVNVPREAVTTNDIIVWTGHMGIAISNTQFVSALNPDDKTAIRNIDGGGVGLLRYGRYRGFE